MDTQGEEGRSIPLLQAEAREGFRPHLLFELPLRSIPLLQAEAREGLQPHLLFGPREGFQPHFLFGSGL